MDHENLKYFREPHKLNRQQARWYLKLQDYDFTLQHIPRKTNMKADILLRKDQVNIKEDNKDVRLLKEELWMKTTYKGIGNYKAVVNSISPSDRWSNRINQSGNRNISTTLCQLPTGQLNRMANSYRVSIQ